MYKISVLLSSNILHCPLSSRINSYCETHSVFLCNTCKSNDVHKKCKIANNIVELTTNITKAESKINTVNSLKRNERNKGKQLLKLIEQLHVIQARLQAFREKQEQRYCRYVKEVSKRAVSPQWFATT